MMSIAITIKQARYPLNLQVAHIGLDCSVLNSPKRRESTKLLGSYSITAQRRPIKKNATSKSIETTKAIGNELVTTNFWR